LLHEQVANTRRDGLHKLTTELATNYDTIVVEHLHVAGMIRNRRLARQIADTGFAELRRQLGYKTAWYGSALHVADRWFPSSKTCSVCGWRNPSLPLRKRVFTCPCGLVMDRDENAAVNLKQLTGAGVAGYPGAAAPNARGGDVRPGLARQLPAKREPRTRVGKTGTVPR